MKFSVCAGVRRIPLRTLWIPLAAGLLAYNAAADSAFISVPLQRTGVDADAVGSIAINLGPTNSTLTLQASKLTAGRTYTTLFGGLVRGRFTANANGHGGLLFAQPPGAGTVPFDFDPRGREFLLVDGRRTVLRARISAPGEPAGSIVIEEARLPRVVGSSGRAHARYELLASGTRRFSVELGNVESGTFTLFVNGLRRRDITVGSGGSAAVVFDNLPGTAEPALSFDPRGLVVDILNGKSLRFSGEFKAKAEGINLARPSIITRSIPSTANSSSGLALARRWVDRNAGREFDIELFNLPLGDYELRIDGVSQGFIPVLLTPAGAFGEMQFSSDADDEDENLLWFQPFASTYTIEGPEGVLFRGKPLRDIVQVTHLSSNMPSEIELPLFNLGADTDGTARAQLKIDDEGRRHFEVELRNVTRDYYLLKIDDIPVHYIWVPEAQNRTRGIIELEDDPESGEELLDFDPRGRMIGIERGRTGTEYFERRFPFMP